MKDKFNREIDYMRISVTDKCNLNCFYCMPNDKDNPKVTHQLSDDEILRIIKVSVTQGITKFRLTGGEPLVRPGIFDLIKKIRNISGISELTLSTNGVLLLGNVAKLKKAGIDRVNVSLDVLDSLEYQNITKYNKVFDYDSLISEIIKEELIPFKLNAVLLKGINDTKINDFIRLADKHDIMIRFIELMEIGQLDFDYKRYYLSTKEVLSNTPDLVFSHSKGNTMYYTSKGKKGLIGFINPVSNKFCDGCNRLRLTADGKIKPCLHSNDEYSVELDDDKYIEESIKNAILRKPKEHELDKKDGTRSRRSMNRIGG